MIKFGKLRGILLCRGFSTGDFKQYRDMDLYRVLGLDKKASGAEIKKRYYELAKQWHPDTGNDKERFQRLQQAYEVLGNDLKRQEYDSYRGKSYYESQFESKPEEPKSEHKQRTYSGYEWYLLSPG